MKFCSNYINIQPTVKIQLDFHANHINCLQLVQRKTVDIEKNAVRQARANSYNISKPPGSNNNSQGSNKSFFEDNFINRKGPTQTQMQEEIDLQALEEQERAIRELEVCIYHFCRLHNFRKLIIEFYVRTILLA